MCVFVSVHETKGGVCVHHFVDFRVTSDTAVYSSFPKLTLRSQSHAQKMMSVRVYVVSGVHIICVCVCHHAQQRPR